MQLAQTIKKLRKIKDITMVQLEEMSGVSRATISQVESGNTIPKADIVIKLSKALECTTDYLLFGGEDDDTNKNDSKEINDKVQIKNGLDKINSCYYKIKDDLVSNNRLVAIVENLIEENKRLNIENQRLNLLLLNEKDLRIQMLMDMKSIHN